MKFQCPICKSHLEHLRVDDGSHTNKITTDGEVVSIGERSNGYDRIYCSKDESHEIPEDMLAAAQELADNAAY